MLFASQEFIFLRDSFFKSTQLGMLCAVLSYI